MMQQFYPRTCFAVHYLAEDFNVALCNRLADMVIVSVGASALPASREILGRITCEKWAYICLNATGMPESTGYARALYDAAYGMDALLKDTDGAPIVVGTEDSRHLVIDPRRFSDWVPTVLDLNLEAVGNAGDLWDGIFIDNGWQDCWPVNHSGYSEEERTLINAFWSLFMSEVGIRFARKASRPIIGNGHWQDFIGRRGMLGRMLENVPVSGSWRQDAEGPLFGEGFAAEVMRGWKDVPRIILKPGSNSADATRIATALSMLFDLWVCPNCGAGALYEVAPQREWYPRGPARIISTGVWERSFRARHAGRIGKVRMFVGDGAVVQALPWE